MTVKLSAESKFGHSGQYIAHIVGRAEKVQFNREFVGIRTGRRNEYSCYETDEIGLYEECDVGKSGKSKAYALVLPWRDGLRKLYSDTADALAIAKRLDNGEKLEDFVFIELGDVAMERQGYRKCSTCERELPDGESCPDHPGPHVIFEYRQVPKLNEAGEPVRELVYTIRKPGEVKKAAAAATLETAIDAIVAALAALPSDLQKKALSAVKAKLFPKTAVSHHCSVCGNQVDEFCAEHPSATVESICK